MRSRGAAKKRADVYRVKIIEMDGFILSEAEWNRVFMPLHPMGAEAFLLRRQL